MSTQAQQNYTLFPHQQLAVDKVLESWNEFDRSLFVAPTGVGKTIIFSSIADQRRAFGNVLILAHRDELIDQAIDKIYRSRGIYADKEKADDRASLQRDVVVGSVQTMCKDSRLARFTPDHFKTIIVDEAHRTLAKSYLNILDYFSGAKVLGVTATPDRGDKKNLSKFYDNLAHEILLRDMIRQGFLCPITVKNVPVQIDLRGVGVRGGDYSEEEVAVRLAPMLESIAQAIREHAADRKILIFVPLVATGAQFAGILQERGFAAEHIHGNSPDRKEILERFANNQTRILVNAMLLTEGYDQPDIDCVLVLRPTKIRSLFAQMVGRGTRVSKETGKQNLLLLDFLWLTDQHDLVKPTSLIADTEKHEEEINAVIDQAGGEMDLLEAEGSATEAREQALARQLARQRNRKARTIDLLELSVMFHFEAEDYEPTFAWHSLGISDKQKAFLEKQGIDLPAVRDRGHASHIMDQLIGRVKKGLATPKQVRLLQRNQVENAAELTFEEASRQIDRISANWRR